MISTTSNLNKCQLINLPRVNDPRGALSFVEANKHIPFSIERVYYLFDLSSGCSRGSHAHIHLEQLIISLSGSFTVKLSDNVNSQTFHLHRPDIGLYVPPMIWRDLVDFSSGAVCMVLASLPYSEDDYIRNHSDFVNHSFFQK